MTYTIEPVKDDTKLKLNFTIEEKINPEDKNSLNRHVELKVKFVSP